MLTSIISFGAGVLSSIVGNYKKYQSVLRQTPKQCSILLGVFPFNFKMLSSIISIWRTNSSKNLFLCQILGALKIKIFVVYFRQCYFPLGKQF